MGLPGNWRAALARFGHALALVLLSVALLASATAPSRAASVCTTLSSMAGSGDSLEPKEFAAGDRITVSTSGGGDFATHTLNLYFGATLNDANDKFITEQPTTTYSGPSSYTFTIAAGQTYAGWATADYSTLNWIYSCIPAANATTVSVVEPGMGATAGGEWVKIRGTNFTGATAVSFDGTAAATFSVSSSTEIMAMTPVHAVGSVEVAVSTPTGGTGALANVFSFATVPDAPTGVAATPGLTDATVTFTPPASNGGATVLDYTVTSSPAGGNVTAGGSPITVTGLSPATTYTFTVTANNVIGASAPSVASDPVTTKSAQTITFADPGAQNFGTTPTLTATSDSGLTVTFTSSTTGVCTITSGGTLAFVTTGTCTINADQAGNATYGAAATVSQSFGVNAVAPGAPTIGTATAGNGQASVSFTAPAFTGGSAIASYTVISTPGNLSATGPASPLTVPGLNNGTSYTFRVTATNDVGVSSSFSDPSNSVTPKYSQSITFANPGAQNFGTTLTLTATSTSGLTPTFTSSTTGVCTVTPSGVLTFVSAGSCTINADQAGNSVYAAATQVARAFAVNAVAPGAPTIGTATAGDTQASVAFSAPASTGGLPISGYTATASPGGLTGTGASSPITVSGLTNGVSYTFSVTATNSKPLTGAASASSNSVTPLTAQTITFNNPGAQTFGTTRTLTATSTSGLTPTFTSSTTGVCTITSGGALTFISPGTCTINANQAGNGSYLAASQVSRSFTVNPAPPVAGAVSLTVAANSSNNPVTLNLSGGAATSVAVAAMPANGAVVAYGTNMTYTPNPGYLGADSFTYTATNAGGTSAPATVSVTVNPVILSIAPASLPAGTAGTAYSTTLSASGGTGPYTYAIAAGALPAGLSLNTTTGALSGTPTTLGTANFTVTATDTLSASGSRAYSLLIGKATPSVVLSASSTSLVVGESVTFTASVTGGASPTGAITFTEGGTTLGSATLSSGTASFSTASLVAGIHSIVAVYAGDGLNASAASAATSVTVAVPSLTLTPGSGGLSAAKVGVPYNLSIAVGGAAGGSLVAGGLPPGLSVKWMDATHLAMLGTPTATGTYTITLDVSSGGATGSATYTLTVTAATPTLSLTATPTSATVGDTVTLTATLSGGASPTGTIQFATNGANIGSAVPLVGGSASVSTSALSVGVHPITAVYSGDGKNGAATSAVVTVTIGTTARPDPGQDPAATAIVTSQAATASRVGQRQIGNTIQRLEQLHDEGERAQAGGGRPMTATADDGMGGPLVRPGGYAGPMLAYGEDKPETPRDGGPGEAANQIFSKVSQAFEAAEREAELPFHLWSTGTVDWGRAGEGGDERFTTSGLTFGVDRRLTDSLTMGIAGGIAIDHTRFGRDTSDGTAYTAQLYASLKLAPKTWLDVVGGYGALQFDSERWAGGGQLTGDRDGSNLFGSVGLSSAYDLSRLRLTGYGRLDIVRMALDGYTESGSPSWALTYGDTDSTTLTGVAGLKASYAIPMDWGTLTPVGRIEYRHALEGGFTQSLGYADVGGFGSTIDGEATTRDSATFGLGLSATTLDGLDLDLEYRLSADGDGIGSQQVRAGFRLPF